DRQRVGEDAAHADIHGGDRIGAGRHQRPEPRNERTELREIGAEITDDIDLDRLDPATAVERRLDTGDIVAALGVAQKMLGTIGEPLHWPAEATRRLQAQRVFAIHKGFGAEAAADIAGLYMEGLERHLEDRLGERVTHAVHALAA